MAEVKDSEDIFYRKRFTFLIQHPLESRMFSWLREKFNVETLMTKKGKLIIVEEKDHEPDEDL